MSSENSRMALRPKKMRKKFFFPFSSRDSPRSFRSFGYIHTASFFFQIFPFIIVKRTNECNQFFHVHVKESILKLSEWFAFRKLLWYNFKQNWKRMRI